MSDFVRFHGSGRVNGVEERCSLAGRRFARLWLGVGGDASRCEGVVQVDFYGEEECALVLGLQRGLRVLVLGRVGGRMSDKGYWNATMFGDAVFPDGRPVAGGGVRQYAHPVPQGYAGEGSASCSTEDIPF